MGWNLRRWYLFTAEPAENTESQEIIYRFLGAVHIVMPNACARVSVPRGSMKGEMNTQTTDYTDYTKITQVVYLYRIYIE